MAKCKCSKCGSTRIVSNIVQNMPNGCFDVCTTPICGSPDELSILAPLIYDEIGVPHSLSAQIFQRLIQQLPTHQSVL